MFNVKLYKDMLKQLRLSGIIFTVLSVLVSLFEPLSFVFSKSSLLNSYIYGYSINLSSISFVLAVSTFVAGFVLVMIAFSFLNKRNSSDYYHSLPNTRVCTYLSIIAAVVTWILIMVVSTVLLTSLVYFACGLSFNISYIFILIAAYTASTLLVAAVTTVAMCITGTLFSNIIVTGLLGFLPRFICYASTMLITSKISFVEESSLGLLNYSYNLPVAFVMNQLITNDSAISYSDLLSSPESILYTLILALLYLGLACFLFHIRKSEVADKNAPNKILQHVYRCAISLPVFLLAFIGFVGNGMKMQELAQWAMLVIAAIVIYFLYELITTKKLKNLLTAAPYLLIVIVISAGITWGSNLTITSFLKDAPLAQDIKYINVRAPYSKWNDRAFTSDKIESIKHDNIIIKNIVSVNLQRCIDDAKSDRMSYLGTENKCWFTITLNNGKTLEREFKISNEDFNAIEAATHENPAFYQWYRQLPSENEITIVQVGNNITASDCKELWETYKQEVTELSNEDYYYLLSKSNYRYKSNNLQSSLYVQSTVGVKNYRDGFPITTLTPKTANLYYNKFNKRNIEQHEKNMSKFMSYNLETATKDDFVNLSLYISELAKSDNRLYHKDPAVYQCEVDSDSYIKTGIGIPITIEQAKSIAKILQDGSFTDLDLSESMVSIYFGMPPLKQTQNSSWDELNKETSTVYVSVTEEQLSEINKIL